MPVPVVIKIEEFEEWVQKEDPKLLINYCDTHNCPVARYLKFKGLKYISVGDNYYHLYSKPDPIRDSPTTHKFDEHLAYMLSLVCKPLDTYADLVRVLKEEKNRKWK